MKNAFVVLASGRGTNFQAIIDRVADGYIPADCTALITDNPNAYVINRAKKAGIPWNIVDYKAFSDKEKYETVLMERIDQYQPNLVILAGYMRLLGQRIVDAYQGRMINIHPSLLPSFPGLHPHKQAIAYGTKVSGCTVHFVTMDTDAGPIIIQRVVPVLCDDTEDTLSDRILTEEHQAFPESIKLYFEKKLMIDGRRVRILP